MKITQLHTLLNTVTQEVLGKTDLVQEDLSNVVDLGKLIIDSDNVDNYVKKLVNHIGKVVFSDRVYVGGMPSVLMDSWEFGSILQKVSGEMPDATENPSGSLTDGQDYSQDVFYQPKVSAKFFNSKVTFEIPASFTERQVKESFSNKEQLNGFITMLTVNIENSMTVKIDSLIARTINNMTAETVVNELGATPDFGLSTVKAVNLLKLFNDQAETPLTVDKALTDKEFIRFATYQIGIYKDRMSRISTLFNVEGKERFTPENMNHTILLSDFSKASDTFLISDAINPESVRLPSHESVPFWQGSGLAYDFADTSRIDVKTASGVDLAMTGILGVMFDRDAVGVANLDRRVTTNYNAKAEFYNNFYKFDAGYYNDLGQNFVVFFIGETVTP